jgi:hypothetical protein
VDAQPVCLKGSLDDASVEEIVQIIAVGRKTGHLSLETTAGSGAIVFQKGRILASVDDGGPPLESGFMSSPGSRRDEIIRLRIIASLDRLARCRQGEFSFRVSAQPPQVIEGRDVARETLRSGIDVVELLVEIACRTEQEEPMATLCGGVPA